MRIALGLLLTLLGIAMVHGRTCAAVTPKQATGMILRIRMPLHHDLNFEMSTPVQYGKPFTLTWKTDGHISSIEGVVRPDDPANREGKDALKHQSELDFRVWVPGRGEVKWGTPFYAEPDQPIQIAGDNTLAYFLEVTLSTQPAKREPPPGDARYTVVEIGNEVLGLQVRALNEQGTVVGKIFQTPQKGILWQKGRFTELKPFPGGSDADPYALNNRGQTVGQSTTAEGQRHACLWENGKTTDLGTLDGLDASIALAINDRGQVAGYAYDSHSLLGEPPPGQFGIYGRSRAFLWEKGHITALPTPEGNNAISAALGINALGQIVGYICHDTTTGPTRAVLWEAGKRRELGALTPEQVTRSHLWSVFPAAEQTNACRALRINDAGLILGWSETGEAQNGHGQEPERASGLLMRRNTLLLPVLWNAGQLELPDLRLTGFRSSGGVLPSGQWHSGFAALNNRGDLLGWGYAQERPNSSAAFVLQGGKTVLLPVSGEPVALNMAGQILLYNSVHSFLLTPTQGNEGR
jgi:probable HAF family extracellular repeat protein